MKLPTLLLVCILTSTIAFSQSKSSLSASIQYGSSFRALGDLPQDDYRIYSIDFHEPTTSYRLELLYGYKIGKHLSFKSGLNYSSLGYIVFRVDDLVWPSEINENGMYVPDPNLGEFKRQMHYEFVEVPVLLGTTLGSGRFQFFADLGFGIGYLLSSEYSTEGGDGGDTSQDSKGWYNALNLFARTAVGIDYSLSDAHQIFVSVNYQHQLNNLGKEEVTERLYDGGLAIGYRLRL